MLFLLNLAFGLAQFAPLVAADEVRTKLVAAVRDELSPTERVEALLQDLERPGTPLSAEVLLEAILFRGENGRLHFDANEAGRLGARWPEIWPRVSFARIGRMFTPAQAVALRDVYLSTGRAEALRWFYRAVTFGAWEWAPADGPFESGSDLLLRDLPAVLYSTPDKSRVMNAFLILIASAFERRLGARYGVGEDRALAVRVVERARALVPLLRQIRDTPDYVRAGRADGDAVVRPLHLKIDRPLRTFLAVEPSWGSTAAVAEFYLALGDEIRDGIVATGYLRALERGCAADLAR